MSDTLPVFAVVGRVNKGKSSIVATLVEEEDPRAIAISHEAGTTTECRQYRVEVDGDALFAVVDTPGFEDAPRMLEWLRERETSAASRSEAIRLFIEHFSEGDEFAAGLSPPRIRPAPLCLQVAIWNPVERFVGSSDQFQTNPI